MQGVAWVEYCMPSRTDPPLESPADVLPRGTEVLPGHLYVVATPIGHLGDCSPRAAAVLAAVDRVCAEDTRTSARLLGHLGLHKPLVALHEHNESRIADGLITALHNGESLALISDAGTPLISDPGFVLVRAARAAKLPVIAVPGPCAAIAALSIAGLPSDRFVFVGFLPPRSAARQERWRALAAETATVIAYESSHRIEDSLVDLVAILGPDRPLCLARELTKRFEQSLTAPAAEVLDWLRADPDHSRGEFVLVVGGAPASEASAIDSDRLLSLLLQELPPAKAARLAAELSGERKNTLYARALALCREREA